MNRQVEMGFEWDARKATANWGKHRVRFEEAITVFNDKLATIFPDPDHSDIESREIIVGQSIFNRVLFVSFVEKTDGRLRIISARTATRKEQANHEEHT